MALNTATAASNQSPHAAPNKYEIVSRVSKIKTFPCTKCHKTYKAGIVELKEPKDHLNMNFKHMPEINNCVLCHDSQNTNQLNLLTGVKISLDDSSILCGQCHGKVEYNWSLGQHGRLGGSWQGVKTQLACTECHEPHSPKFPSMNAVANPPKSVLLIEKGESDEPKR